MCLCVLFYHHAPFAGVAMAANREERYDRAADRPSWICREPGVFAGRDRTAGGTWQGINEHGLLVALTNRRGGGLDPTRRSRGHLCLEALRQPDAWACADWLTKHLARTPYNPCNLLCVDQEHAFSVHYRAGTIEMVPLEPGIHLLADTDVNDEEHPRIVQGRELLAGCEGQPWPELRETLTRMLADHAEDKAPEAAICRHGEVGGTVSSSLICLDRGGIEESEFWFAEGAPCVAGWVDLSRTLHQLPS